VFFSTLRDEDINYYIERYKPFDKAGGYGIQEWIGQIGVERIEGCFYNVMGLPIHQVWEHLNGPKFQID
jgi:septum formation protein